MEHHSDETGAARTSGARERDRVTLVLPVRRLRLPADRALGVPHAGSRPRARADVRRVRAGGEPHCPTWTPGRSGSRSGRGNCTSWPRRSSTSPSWGRCSTGRRLPGPARRGRRGSVPDRGPALSVDGRMMAMFPEGTRSAERAAQEAPAAGRIRAPPGSRWRRASRSSRPRSRGWTGCRGSALCECAFGPPIPVEDLRALRSRDAGKEATDRLWAEITRLEAELAPKPGDRNG